MTPRQRAIAALTLNKPEGLVPHLELEFQLSEEFLGQAALYSQDIEGVSGSKREDLLKRNAELWVKVAQRLDWSVITGIHWLPLEDQLKSFQYIKQLAGDTYMLSGFCDGTFHIPSGENMVEHALWLRDSEQEALAEAQRKADQSIETGLQLIQGGAEVIFMCADYCFNDGPFLSPAMFRQFVTPFLKQIITAWRKAGALVVKHTDGNIMPILDQLVECQPHALHSLDPMAGIDIRQVKDLVGERLCLIGNVNCALIQAGTQEEITESARYCLKYGGVQSGGYIFSSSNCIFQGVPLENYLHMLRVREEYGAG